MEPQRPIDWRLEAKGFVVGLVLALILVGLAVTALAAGWLPDSDLWRAGYAAVAAGLCMAVSSAWVRRRRD